MKLVSNTVYSRLVAVLFAAMGSLFLYGALTPYPGLRPNPIIVFLAVAFFAMALGMFLFDRAVVIEIADGENQMTITRNSFVRTDKKIVPFDQVAHIKIQRVGVKPPIRYHMIIFLKDGSNFHSGQSSADENELVARASALATRIRCEIA